MRCLSAFLEGACDDSQTQLHSTIRHWVPELEQKGKSFLAYLRPVRVLFSPHGFISLSDEPFSLAKVVQTGATPINRLRSGRNYHGSLPQIAYNLGIP